MTKYREILRLKSLGFSERNIAHSCGVSRNTVAKVVKRAAEMNLSWPLDHDMTDNTLEEMLFPMLWSSFFVTLVAKKYRLATMLPFEPRMVCDSR